MHFDEIQRRLALLDTPSLCDADKGIRVMDPVIRPICKGLKLIGRAHTVSCCDDFLTVIQALNDAEKGEVLVIDGQGGRHALAGELFTTEARRKELAGIVIDGAVRDTRTIRQLGLPVYARWVFPNAGTTQTLADTQILIDCGGVSVVPGDILFGDDDGIIVASESELIELIPQAERIQQTEALVLEQMSAGKNLLEMLNFQQHVSQLKSGKESKLTFTL